MKKFISALSSLVIAATAMGGALAFSTDAATNGEVDSTIIEFRSNGKNAVEGKAGETVPVTVYVPQSSGFYSLSLKMAINGKETLGKGSVTDLKGKVHENYKYAFGNYGIKIKNVSWPDIQENEKYFCLDSGFVSESDMFAGYAFTSQMTFFTEDAYNIQYQAAHAVQKELNIDAVGPWVEAGKPSDYSSYKPVYTWTKDEKWAYQYEFVNFDLELPKDLADGTYTLDLYYDEYYNNNPSALFDETTNEELPDDKKTIGQTSAAGVKGNQKLTSVPLTITVGKPSVTTAAPATTTAAPTTTTAANPGTTAAPTTTTAAPAQTTAAPATTTGTPVGDDAIIYDLVPHGKEFTAAPAKSAGQNVYKATAGEDLTIDWTVKNDGGTAGLQIYFDFSQIEYVSGKIGNAYRVAPQFNDANANVSKADNAADGGQVVYTFGGKDEQKAKDGAVIYSFNVKVPSKNGTYSITQDDRNPTKVVPKNQDKPYTVLVHGLDIVVGEPEIGTTAAPATTTAAPATTTAAPTTTTVAGQTTTAAPATTTAAPATTTAAGQTTTATPAGTVKYGDVNCDGEVKINDVVLLNRWLNKTATVTDQGLKNADCDANGTPDEKDSDIIQEFLARIIKALPKK